MLNRLENPTNLNFEMHQSPDGRVVESYAGGKVKVYDGHSPKTTIDIPEFNTHISIHKHGPFEFNKAHEVSEVFVRKGHHKGKFALAFGDKIDGKGFEYNAWSPEGIIGTASGKRLDLLIASLFYEDPDVLGQIEDASMDNQVVRYLKFALITAGTNLHQI